MPTEAFELSQRALAAIEARDLETFLSLVDENVEFVSLVAEAEGGTYRGHEGVKTWWETVGESLGTLHYEPQESRDLGGGGVMTRLLVSGTVAEVEVQQVMWHVVQVLDNKAVWWGVFRTDEEALRSLEAFRGRSQVE